MQVDCFPTAQEAARHVAKILIDTVQAHPATVLGLATGRTMVPVYAEICDMAPTSFGDAVMFGLDEYLGLGAGDPGSFHSYLERQFYDHLNPPPRLRCLPDGRACAPVHEAARYEDAIRANGGIGLQLLGLGGNGHIGFNEPGTAFDSRTRVVSLSQATRAANAGQIPGGNVPHKAITMGIGTIRASRRCVLLATGAAKAAAVNHMMHGPVDPSCPASALRLHDDVLVVLDDAASSQL